MSFKWCIYLWIFIPSAIQITLQLILSIFTLLSHIKHFLEWIVAFGIPLPNKCYSTITYTPKKQLINFSALSLQNSGSTNFPRGVDLHKLKLFLSSLHTLFAFIEWMIIDKLFIFYIFTSHHLYMYKNP